DGSANISELPSLRRTIKTVIERLLAMGPVGKTANRSGAKQALALAQWKRHANDLQRRRRQIDKVRAMVLGTLLRQLPGPGLQIELVRARAAHFLGPAAEQD